MIRLPRPNLGSANTPETTSQVFWGRPGQGAWTGVGEGQNFRVLAY